MTTTMSALESFISLEGIRLKTIEASEIRQAGFTTKEVIEAARAADLKVVVHADRIFVMRKQAVPV